MRRKIRVRLTRRVGKKVRSTQVVVRQVTLGGFQEALRVAGEAIYSFQRTMLKGGPLSGHAVGMALAMPEATVGIADVLCPDMPRGWFLLWHSERNIHRMIAAAQQTSDWGRLIGELKLGVPGTKPAEPPKKQGKKDRKGVGLYDDAIALARILGVNPREIIDEWPMERFLDMAESVVRSIEAAKDEEFLADPTMDPDAKPTPLVPGLGKQWVN